MVEKSKESKEPEQLNLDEEKESPIIILRGVEYPLKTSIDFTMAESAKVRRLVIRMQSKLSVVDDLDVDDDDEKYAQAIEVLDSEAEKLLDFVVELPPDVRSALTTKQKMAILGFFTAQSWGTLSPSVMSAISAQG